MINTPVLLIGFNRPDTLQQVFESVRKVQPSVLYVAIDGPRNEQDSKSCEACRTIVSKVDWPCEVHTCFRTKNLGCGYGPAEAITWAFENEDRLIILEDDVVPSQSFFSFCEEMLEKYKNDTRVNMISGRSHNQGSKYFRNRNYIFTHYAHSFGWATWKRCWKHFDIKMKDFPEFQKIGGANNVLLSEEEGSYFNKWFEKMYNNINQECTHSWDGQWFYARIKMGALGIVPSRNLVLNIGVFGTHSNGHLSSHDIIAEDMQEKIKHPFYVLPYKEYESMHFHNHIHVVIPLYKRICHRIQRWVK